MTDIPDYIKTLFPTNPDWLYHPAAIDPDSLPAIQAELLTIYQAIPDRHKWGPTTFNIVDDHDLIRSQCPVLVDQLQRLKIFNLLEFIGFITVDPAMKFPMHIDNNPGDLEIALNIPVENCHDSYTVWYNTTISTNPAIPYIKTISGDDNKNSALLVDEEHAVEIGRCSANAPYWININVPHNLMCDHKLIRVGSSLRFRSLHKLWDKVTPMLVDSK